MRIACIIPALNEASIAAERLAALQWLRDADVRLILVDGGSRDGTADIAALMEDIALSKRLKRLGRPACLSGPVVSSSRRWEHNRIRRTILLMWALRLGYWLGADPVRLARRYDRPARRQQAAPAASDQNPRAWWPTRGPRRAD